MSIERFSIGAKGRRYDPSGVRSFSLMHTGGGATSLHPRANGLQAFGLNEANSPTVSEESRDCPPLLIAPDNFSEISFEASHFQDLTRGSNLDPDFELDGLKRSRCALTCLPI